jgi:hypothetical protein
MDRTRLARTAGILILVVLGIQIFRPPRENPPSVPSQAVAAHVAMPADVSAILHRSCDDCHSNQTRWPWYSGVAPISWFVIGHVNDGRRQLNFDDWSVHSSRRTAPPLDLICGQVTKGGMPLSSYLLVHWDAKLSSEDVAVLCAWKTPPSRGTQAP